METVHLTDSQIINYLSTFATHTIRVSPILFLSKSRRRRAMFSASINQGHFYLEGRVKKKKKEGEKKQERSAHEFS